MFKSNVKIFGSNVVKWITYHMKYLYGNVKYGMKIVKMVLKLYRISEEEINS